MIPFLVSAHLSDQTLPDVTGLLWQRPSFSPWLRLGGLAVPVGDVLGQLPTVICRKTRPPMGILLERRWLARALSPSLRSGVQWLGLADASAVPGVRRGGRNRSRGSAR